MLPTFLRLMSLEQMRRRRDTARGEPSTNWHFVYATVIFDVHISIKQSFLLRFDTQPISYVWEMVNSHGILLIKISQLGGFSPIFTGSPSPSSPPLSYVAECRSRSVRQGML